LAADLRAAIRRLTARLRTAVRQAPSAPAILEGLARVGHATRGLVYLLVGVLAMASALSERVPPNLAGAFSVIERLPGGWLLLLAIALGLCAFGSWRAMQALLDLRGFGWQAKGLLRRTALLVEASAYAGLGFLAIVMSLGQGAGFGEEFTVTWTGRILDWPLGHWMIAAIGVGAIGVGCGQLLRARRMAFEDIDAGAGTMTAIRLVGRLGLAAKGVVFGAIGVLLLTAAYRTEAAAAGGMRAALAALAGMRLGSWVLLAVSVGLTLHGAFGLTKAWYHKPVTPKRSPTRPAD
jgi:hypothetical protein